MAIFLVVNNNQNDMNHYYFKDLSQVLLIVHK